MFGTDDDSPDATREGWPASLAADRTWPSRGQHPCASNMTTSLGPGALMNASVSCLCQLLAAPRTPNMHGPIYTPQIRGCQGVIQNTGCYRRGIASDGLRHGLHVVGAGMKRGGRVAEAPRCSMESSWCGRPIARRGESRCGSQAAGQCRLKCGERIACNRAAAGVTDCERMMARWGVTC